MDSHCIYLQVYLSRYSFKLLLMLVRDFLRPVFSSSHVIYIKKCYCGKYRGNIYIGLDVMATK